jgi:hypothetical protein
VEKHGCLHYVVVEKGCFLKGSEGRMVIGGELRPIVRCLVEKE